MLINRLLTERSGNLSKEVEVAETVGTMDTGLLESKTQDDLTKKVERIFSHREHERLSNKRSLAQEVLDISGVLQDGSSAIADDSFWCCFRVRSFSSQNLTKFVEN